METPKDRLLQLLAKLGMGQGRFEKSAGISNGNISKIKANVSNAMLHKIEKAYSNVNIEWIRTGKGKMFLTPTALISSHLTAEQQVCNSQRSQLLAEMAAQQDTITRLQSEIERAQKQISECQKIIAKIADMYDIE